MAQYLEPCIALITNCFSELIQNLRYDFVGKMYVLYICMCLLIGANRIIGKISFEFHLYIIPPVYSCTDVNLLLSIHQFRTSVHLICVY